MSKELREHLEQELRIPIIRSERCVHSHIETASCKACVEICPHHAWQLSDESLGIDISVCDGCGLCIPVCPEGVILPQHSPLLRQMERSVLAFVACEKIGLKLGKGVIPCLHALGIQDLLKLYQHNVRGLVISIGDCQHCVGRSTLNFYRTLNTINTALTQRNAPILILRELNAETWQTQQQHTTEASSEEKLSRRHFFRQGFRDLVEESLKAKGVIPQENEQVTPPGLLLPLTETAGTLPYVPQLEATQCDGCEACLNICPHEVLLFDRENRRYLIAAEKCTGCHICVDVCVKKAIHIEEWIIPTTTQIALHHARCRRCGVQFYRPQDYTSEQSLCHICNQVNHHSKLFQVLD